MARQRYSREFRLAAVNLVNEQGYSIEEAAKNLGVDLNHIRGWIANFSADPDQAPSGEAAMAAELQRLRKENARLLMEHEILKKAAQFFDGKKL